MSIVAKILEILISFPDGVPQSYLAKALDVSKSYLSIVLKDLEKKGLVYRVKVGNVYIVKLVKTSLGHVLEGKVLRLGIIWSSEYLFLGYFAKMLKDKEGMELKVQVYPSALQAVLALIKGEVDAVLSPIVTQLYGYMISKNIVIVGGGAGGGGYVYELPHSLSDVIISSEISTMDLCRALALKKKYVETSVSSTKYFSSAQEAISMARRGLARYVVVWHPINIDIENIGGRKILECSEFEELVNCCTLAVSRFLNIDTIEKIGNIYKESIELFNRDRVKFLEWYSNIVGIGVDVLRRALNEYKYTSELTPKQFGKIVDALGLEIPVKTYLYSATQV